MENKKYKVFRIIARLNTGGPARHVVWLTAGLSKQQFDSVLVCGSVPPGEGDMGYFAAENDVQPVIIPEMSRELSLKDTVSLWKIYRELLRVKPDLIHTHTAKAGTLGRIAGFAYRWLTPKTLLGKPRRVRLVHTYHGHVFHSYYSPAKTFFFLTIERILARLATDRILVLSEQQRREINQDFKVGRTKQFRIVPLGIDLALLQNGAATKNTFRCELNVANQDVLVGIVGRLTEIKNHSLFLRVVKLWQDRQGSNSQPVRFVIIGDGHLRNQLEREAVELGISKETLIFAGERQDPHVFYPAFDVVALTSLNEGTPLTLIEAMATKRPVISTAVGGVVDLLGLKNAKVNVFEVAERGVAVGSENAEAFFAGLKVLLENEDLRRKLAARGAQFVAGCYSKERLLSDIESIYYQLLND